MKQRRKEKKDMKETKQKERPIGKGRGKQEEARMDNRGTNNLKVKQKEKTRNKC